MSTSNIRKQKLIVTDMATVRDFVDVLMSASVSRSQVEDEKAADAARALVIDFSLKPDELLSFFELIPHHAVPSATFQALLPRFFDAEKQLGRNDASRSLVLSGFRGCTPHSGKGFVQIAST